jgi:hypothetical protein
VCAPPRASPQPRDLEDERTIRVCVRAVTTAAPQRAARKKPAVGALLALLVLGWPMASSLVAQTTSTMAGAVRDPQGGALPGVTVMARHLGTELVRSTLTGPDGAFTLPLLPVGPYEVRAELEGFRAAVRRGVELTVGETLVLALRLETGELAEEISVVGRSARVNTRQSELSYLVGAEAIEMLPLNGRNFTDLAMLQPGVAPYVHRDGGSVVAHGVGMTVNGQDPRSNVYLLDGTLLNDFTNGPAGSAAGTALGLETIREFRVEVNAYGAEYGRNSGGQVSVISKSGTNTPAGSAYYFHRNDALDARNFFDTERKPEFWRHQFGATAGGPIARDRLFYFAGYEGLQERLGLTRSIVVPDENARLGLLPDPANPGRLVDVGVNAAVRPFLDEFPLPNGPSLGGGFSSFTFPFPQRLRQHYGQARVDYNAGQGSQLFARYTMDDADQFLPTDFPQFPRSFRSRNQFFTGEYRQIASERTVNTFRFGFSRTRIGQVVESNTTQPLPAFVPGRPFMGGIDIGGIPARFGPQTSAWVQLVQNVFSGQFDQVQTRGRHMLKLGGLVEHYQNNMVNPTFSLGIYNFPSLQAFLQNRPVSFIGLTPEGQFDRYWRFTLFGIYAQDEWRVHPRVTLNGGLRYEFATMPEEKYGRDSALIDLMDPAPTPGPLYQNPTYTNLSPRVGAAWDVGGDGRTAVRGGYGLYFNTNNHQNLIVTVTNPPATPRVIISNPTFPEPPFERGIGNSIRPIQWDLQNPRVHVWNASVQRELPYEAVVTVGYAGSRGLYLLRSSDVNVAQPVVLPDGTPFIPAGTPRLNPAFSTIEMKSSDGDSWYRALILDVRRRWRQGVSVQSSYTWSRSEDTTQASTFFSDATNGTTTAFPEFVPGYNKGPSDFDATHNWVLNFTVELPVARGLDGVGGAVLGGWQLSGIWQMRSGNPLTVFVAANRSRSQWNPSLGPGIGRDRPSYAPGRGSGDAVVGRPDMWFDPTAFVLQPAGTFGNTGRGDFRGPNMRTLDLALVKNSRMGQLGGRRVEVRLEVFNVLNRANFAPPALTVFSGQTDNEAPLASFGRIRSTTTSARQVQLGVRVGF